MTDWLPKSTFIIAELSANHNNSLPRALQTIKAMADSGADAVKIQTYRPESLCLDIDNQYFGKRKAGLWQGRTLWSLYQEASLPYEWHKPLQDYAHSLGLVFFSSPFDEHGVDFLADLDVPMYKIASFEINHIPLITHVAKQGKPIIMSTGVATEADIQLALDTCYNAGNYQVAILKCTSQYPATIADANLKTILDMQQRYQIPVGLSDHTLGSMVPIVAVSLGARIVEKHFTLNRADGGPDSAFSMEPAEFSLLVKQIRDAESSLGAVRYDLSEADKLRRRSVFFCNDLSTGTQITAADIKVLRNGSGLHPKYVDTIIGNTLIKNAAYGEPVTSDYLVAPVDTSSD